MNPVLRGWVNYFAVGHSSECFSFIRDWVEKKIRRHLGRARNRKGFGWKRWSRRWLYEEPATVILFGLLQEKRVFDHNNCTEALFSAGGAKEGRKPPPAEARQVG